MTETDAVLAARLAHEAGALLLELRRSYGAGPGLRATADRGAHEFLAAELDRNRPRDHLLSEEAADDLGRLDADRVWIIDPLDGTKEYGEGRSDWAVHVALWQRDGEHGRLTAGAVALPGLDRVLATEPSPAEPRPEPRRWRIAVSRSRPIAVAERIARDHPVDLVPMGSAGYKAAATVLGTVDAYVHEGGQYQWDSAAPVAVAEAAGLHASRLDGSPLRYNVADTYLPDLVVARPAIAAPLLRLCRAPVPDPEAAATRSAP